MTDFCLIVASPLFWLSLACLILSTLLGWGYFSQAQHRGRPASGQVKYEFLPRRSYHSVEDAYAPGAQAEPHTEQEISEGQPTSYSVGAIWSNLKTSSTIKSKS
jgi:hypothetical protein